MGYTRVRETNGDAMCCEIDGIHTGARTNREALAPIRDLNGTERETGLDTGTQVIQDTGYMVSVRLGCYLLRTGQCRCLF